MKSLKWMGWLGLGVVAVLQFLPLEVMGRDSPEGVWFCHPVETYGWPFAFLTNGGNLVDGSWRQTLHPGWHFQIQHLVGNALVAVGVM